MQLRWYQAEAVQAVQAYWRKGGGNPLVDVPTGGGKSLILAELARWVVKDCGGKVMIATHRKELIEQDAEAIHRLAPSVDVGIFSSGVGLRQIRPCTVAGVQSIYNKPRLMGKFDVVIVDEAHLVSSRTGSQYHILFENLRKRNPDLRICGLTATPYRLGQGLLTEGDGKLFDSIVYRVDMRKLIEEGHLVPLRSGTNSVEINLNDVKVSNGEYVTRDLELAANVSEVTDGVIADVVKSGRRHVLAFCCGVEHAAHIRNAARMAGLSSEMVLGSTPKLERIKILNEFKHGRIQLLASCDVLSTGFNVPQVDLICLVRATKSTALYVQSLGRGTRVAEGKTDCLVYDYGGNIARHGPVDAVSIRSAAKRNGGETGQKMCPDCYAEIHFAKLTCQHCGHEFPPPERKERKANSKKSDLEVLSDGKTRDVTYTVSERSVTSYLSSRSGKEMLRVEYFDREASHKPVAVEWVCIEHDGYARQKAESWWGLMTDGLRCPRTVEEALDEIDALRTVKTITIRNVPGEKYPKVIRWGFSTQRTEVQDDLPF